MRCATICATSKPMSRGSAKTSSRAGSRACTTCAATSASSPALSRPWQKTPGADRTRHPHMAITTRNSRRSSIDIWPGFVDALAQLLMVIIFILLIFTAGQFYLSEALSGRDQALKQLQQQVTELADLLALEKRASEDLRLGAAQLQAQLQSALSQRDVL